MIIISTLGRKIGLSFMHPTVEDAKKRQPKRKTICQLYELVGTTEHFPGTWELKVSSEVPCSRDDNFSKAVGRKLSLKRALCQHDFGFKAKAKECFKCGNPRQEFLVLPKEARAAIWEKFKTVTRGPHNQGRSMSNGSINPTQEEV